MKLLNAILILVFITLKCVPAFALANDHRLKIQIFRYGGAEGDASRHFDTFYKIIKEKMRVLHLKMKKKTKEAAYLEHLAVSQPLNDTIETPAQLYEHWEDQQALEVMSGTLWPESEGKYSVKSTIYLGGLDKDCKYMDERSVVVDLDIIKEEYVEMVDSHSLVTLIALALDAMRLKTSTDLIGKLLATAKDTLSDLKKRRKLSSSNLELLGSTIEAINKAIADKKEKRPAND